MEGICGIISFNGEIPNIGYEIDLMAKKLSDGEPLQILTCAGKNWALACGGWREPHWSPLTFAFSDERFAIVGVADLFNLGEIRTLVGGPSDDVGRLMVNGYLQFGCDFLSRIHGNFAFMLVDLQEREFIAATDKIGIRPLCWYRRGNVYYVGSRIGVIREVCDALTIDHNAIYAYVLYSMIPSPQTIYKDVQKLEAGSLIHADPEGVRVKRYWDIKNQPKRLESETRIAESVYHCIHEAVTTTRDGCTEAGEVGCFLSGGTDSSSVCGLLRQSFDSPISAYSIGFPARGYDEMHYARIAARAFRLEHHDYYMRPDDVLSELHPIVAAYDEPFDNSSVFPALLCARLASEKGAHYMFAGDGGDEIFGGNERYGTQKIFEDYFKIPRLIRIWLLESLLMDRLERLPIIPLRQAAILDVQTYPMWNASIHIAISRTMTFSLQIFWQAATPRL
jgi:asparagine synthase (glutamine-hydrolysing)